MAALGGWMEHIMLVFFNFKGVQVDSAAYVACAGILEQAMGARNRTGIGLSYRPARLHRMAESISWNRFLVSIKV
jgi:hypothetical protein